MILQYVPFIDSCHPLQEGEQAQSAEEEPTEEPAGDEPSQPLRQGGPQGSPGDRGSPQKGTLRGCRRQETRRCQGRGFY